MTEKMLIKTRPCGLYESYVADSASVCTSMEVRRDGQDGITVLNIGVRSYGLKVRIELNDDELDTLATMLRDAYNSQEREE